jgi:uncharacterized protein (TIGR02646 family)
MIRVTRGLAPAGFAERATDWTRRFAAARRHDTKLSASAFWSSVRGEIKADAEELRRRFHGKCAFCEGKMEHVSNPHIEHYRPKSRAEFEQFMFAWENWLLSCGRCNQSKWAHFPMCAEGPSLLNPTTDDPRLHVIFQRAVILGLSQRGTDTIRLVGLGRMPLKSERASWLCRIDSLLLLASSGQSAHVKAESRGLLIWAMQDDAPYSAMTMAYLRLMAPKLVNPAVPHSYIAEADQVERIRELVEMHAEEIAQID